MIGLGSFEEGRRIGFAAQQQLVRGELLEILVRIV